MDASCLDETNKSMRFIITASRSSSLFPLTTKQLQEVVSPKSFRKLSLSTRFYLTSTSRRKDPLTLLRKKVTTAPFVVNERYYSQTVTTHNEDDGDHFRFPKLTGNILVIGDGDFSYSVALARINQIQGDAQITASSVDTGSDIINTYSEGETNLNILDLDSNVKLKFSLDVTTPRSFGSKPSWDSIVWNFPYPTATHRASIKDAAKLLRVFFEKLVPTLKVGGCVYVSLSGDQGTQSMWDIEDAAWKSNLLVRDVLSFDASKIDGYNPKRSFIDEDIPLYTCDCFTYVIYHETEQQQKIRREHFLQIDKLTNTRRDFYDCCVTTPSQAFMFLKEEIETILRQFWKIYWNKFGINSKNCLGTLKAIATNGISRIIDSCRTLSVDNDVLIKASEVNSLLAQEDGQIDISQFPKLYEAKFGRLIAATRSKLVEILKSLSLVENFRVDEYPTKSTKLIANCSSAEIYQLLRVADDQTLDINQFCKEFEIQFKRAPFARGVNFSKCLKKLSQEGRFKFEHNFYGSQHLSLNNDPIDGINCTTEEICKLLDDNSGELDATCFRSFFEKKYGKNPIPNNGVVKNLEKLSRAGRFRVERRGSSCWITKTE